MRIVSSFRDYYDSVQSYGMDKSCVYPRTKRVLKYDRRDKVPIWHNDNANYFYGISVEPQMSVATVGFCGRTYQAVCLHGKYGPDTTEAERKDKYYYTAADVIKHLEFKPKNNNQQKQFDYGVKQIEQLFEVAKTNKHKSAQFFEEQDCPIFTVRDTWNQTEIVINDCLRPYEFFRVYEPHLAFQEIYYFLANVLATKPKEIPPIDDVTMCEIKGFDSKSSFRKPKAK